MLQHYNEFWMKLLRPLLLVYATCLALPGLARAEPTVVVSIKPIHSLVAGVMDGVGEPELIVDGAASPHTYSLRPSQAAHLEEADVVFWIGPQLETFLAKPLETLGRNASVTRLDQADDLTMVELREGGTFEDHDHEVRAGHEEHADHDTRHNHDAAFNAHIWLDPLNARALVHAIEETLSKADPQNAERYSANAESLARRIDALTAEVATTLEPVRGKTFVVFHDAYSNFENRFGISAAGSVTVSPEVSPGAARIAEIRDRVGELDVTCVFSEPQFDPKLIRVITEGTAANAGVLDPLGTHLGNGAELYFQLIRALANEMRDCLSGNS
jgi:zinc transport system substrate-binding protein